MNANDQQVRVASTKVRLPYFDNVKYILICCVVVGHIIKFGAMDSAAGARALGVWLYSFHMPLFIFLSGLFLTRKRMTPRKTAVRVIQYLLLGYLAKILRKSVPFMLGLPVSIDLWSEGGLPWFMFALSAYYLLAWVLQWCNYAAIGIGSVVLALYVGYIPTIGDFLCLSRIIVFFPFFWLGHALSPGAVRRHFERKEIKLACAAVLAASALVCIRFSEVLYPYRDLFLGRSAYEFSPIGDCSWVNRFAAYSTSLVMSYAVLGVVPQGHVPLVSVLGTRTLQVYLLHYEVIELLDHTGVIRAIIDSSSLGWTLLIPLGVIIAIVLSLLHLPKHTEGEKTEKMSRSDYQS